MPEPSSVVVWYKQKDLDIKKAPFNKEAYLPEKRLELAYHSKSVKKNCASNFLGFTIKTAGAKVYA